MTKKQPKKAPIRGKQKKVSKERKIRKRKTGSPSFDLSELIDKKEHRGERETSLLSRFNFKICDMNSEQKTSYKKIAIKVFDSFVSNHLNPREFRFSANVIQAVRNHFKKK